MRTETLTVYGAFSIKELLNRTESNGVYIYTFQHGDEYLAEWVGQTKRKFSTRAYDHLQAQLEGKYNIYKVSDLKNGITTLLFDAESKPKPKDPAWIHFRELQKENHELIDAWRVFIIPTNFGERPRLRLETGIAVNLLKHGKVVANILLPNARAKWLKDGTKRDDEEPVEVRIEPDKHINGIPSKLAI